jgi:hypothetical protein
LPCSERYTYIRIHTYLGQLYASSCAESLFLAAANAQRANAPKAEIPIPVVRPVAEDDIAQPSCPGNRPRRRKQVIDTIPVDRCNSDTPTAKTPGEALAVGVWTELRVWDQPEYRARAHIATGVDQRRASSGMQQILFRMFNGYQMRERGNSVQVCMSPYNLCGCCAECEASPRTEATPRAEISSGMVIPDSTCPTHVGAQATLQPPTAHGGGRSRTSRVLQDSDTSAQENVASPIEDTARVEPQLDMSSAGSPAVLFSCLAAMGHSTRNRLSALAAVVSDSPDADGLFHPVAGIPGKITPAAGDRGVASAKAAAASVPSKKRNVAARELGISADFALDIGGSRQSNAVASMSALCRTRAGSSAPPSVTDRTAAQPPAATAATPRQHQRNGCRSLLSVEPVLDVHVPRAKRSTRSGSAQLCTEAQKRQLQDAGGMRKGKRLKISAEDVKTEAAVHRAVYDSEEEMQSDSDIDMKSNLCVHHGQVRETR